MGDWRSDGLYSPTRFLSQRRSVSLCRKPIFTRDAALSKDLRNEIYPNLPSVDVRYADKIVSADHEVMVRSRKRSIKSQLLEPPNQLCP